jgi:hypothetical protein
VPGGCGFFEHPDTGKFICDCGPCDACEPAACEAGPCGSVPDACGGVTFCGAPCGFGTCGDDRGADLAVSPATGEVIAAGSACPAAGACEPYLLRFDGEGLAGEHFLGALAGPGLSVTVRSVAVAANGRIYLAGFATDPGDAKGLRKGFAARLGPDLATQWVYVSTTPSVFEDVLLPIDQKNPILAGFQETGGPDLPEKHDPWIVKLDEADTTKVGIACQWVPDDAQPGIDEAMTGLALAPSGQVLAVGRIATLDDTSYTNAHVWLMNTNCQWIYGQQVGNPGVDDGYEDVAVVYGTSPLVFWAAGFATTGKGVEGLLVQYHLPDGKGPDQKTTLYTSSSSWPSRFHAVCPLQDGSVGVGGARGTGFASSDAWMKRFVPQTGGSGGAWAFDATYVYPGPVIAGRPDVVSACIGLEDLSTPAGVFLVTGRIQQTNVSDPGTGELLLGTSDPDTGAVSCAIGEGK